MKMLIECYEEETIRFTANKTSEGRHVIELEKARVLVTAVD